MIGFVSFLIWELTEKNPIVDLTVFRHRGYTISVLTISLTFGAFFSSIVLTPLWLQTNMGYTATWSGYVMGMNGIFALIAAPIAAKLTTKIDLRKLVSFGILWLAFVTFMRSFGNSDMTFAQLALPLLCQGAAMPFFFIPLSGLALSSVHPNQIASAAGLMNFMRTLAGAFAASLVTTVWDTQTTIHRTELVSVMQPHPEISIPVLDKLVQSQSVVLATNHIFLRVAVIFIIAAIIVWLAPKKAQT